MVLLTALVKEDSYRAWQRALNADGGTVVSSFPIYKNHIHVTYTAGRTQS